jgi:hypothetical protein
VSSVYDLVNSRVAYDHALRVLVELLPLVHHDRIKEGIVRALTTVSADRSVADALLAEFDRIPGDTHSSQNVKWAIGNALSECADESHYDRIVSIVRKRELGWIRRELPLAIARAKGRRREAIDELIRSLADTDLVKSALLGLGILGAPEATPILERYLNDENEQVVAAARQAIRMIKKRDGGRAGHKH